MQIPSPSNLWIPLLSKYSTNTCSCKARSIIGVDRMHSVKKKKKSPSTFRWRKQQHCLADVHCQFSQARTKKEKKKDENETKKSKNMKKKIHGSGFRIPLTECFLVSQFAANICLSRSPFPPVPGTCPCPGWRCLGNSYRHPHSRPAAGGMCRTLTLL